jgi:ketosteroid isomerase-like protein
MTDSDGAARDELLAAEQARCRAWEGGDASPLAELLADDLWYVHTHGKRDTKASLMSALQHARQRVERDDLRVRVFGDTALMTGGITVTIESGQVFVSHVVQVWRRREGGGWELVAQQSTPKFAETPGN